MTDNKEKKYKYAYLAFKSTQLGRVLDKLKKHYIEEKEPDYLVVPYILTCAAYLESKLNDSFHDAEKIYGEDFSNSMKSMSLPKKLLILVPVLTNGKYEINKEHLVYQRLMSLIRVRNNLAHAKSEIVEINAKEDDLVDVPIIGYGMGKVPKEFRFGSDDITLGASKTFTPLEYHEALDKLEKGFFRRYPDRLSKVAMVVDRAKLSRWEVKSSTFVKYLDK